MGSSKKHKEKDREHKHKRKHRSRDRSRSKERKHRDKASRGSKSDGSKRAKYDQDYVAQGDLNMPYSIRVDAAPVVDESLDTAEGANDGKNNLSLSIEETNKLRAKLGLKPLDTPASSSKEDSVKKEDDDVHAPPINIGQVKRTEELREKVHQLKEKRRLQSKMGKMKPLTAAESDDDESAMAWVMKSRKLEEDRMKADQRARMLEEMDNEFGIGSLVEAEFGQKKGGYGAKDLKGLRVEHSQENFAEGKTVILTLKDKRILDEDDEGDTLINVNMIDDEHAAKNVETKKRKPDYKPYDEPEYDEYGMLKQKEILDKYDEEIHGQKKESFEIGGGGRYNAEHERFMKQMIADIRQQKQELTLPPPTLASEFYSPEEMAAFKKPKKKKDRGLRKKMKLTADDLLATIKEEPAESRIQDDVAMEERPVRIKTEVPESIPGLDLTAITIDADGGFDDGSTEGPDEDLTGVLIEEEKAAVELELALKRARKVNVERKVRPPEKVTIDEAEKMDDLPASSSGVVIDFGAAVMMNSTSEFCRALGEIPTYGLAGNREENDDEMMDYDQDADPRNRNDREDDEFATGWQSVEIDTRPIDINSDDKAVLDDEPVVNQGLAAALQLADKKGYLERQSNKGTGAPRNNQLEAQNYSIEDKRYDDLDEKYRKRDRYSGGMTMEFKEKEGYKPEIKLEYVDDAGRKMSEKEAFRILSHRFHGKGSGKKKTEKRLKKIEEEQMMRTMSSTDTPLNTVHLLQERQKANKMPYVILSGGKGIAANNIAK